MRRWLGRLMALMTPLVVCAASLAAQPAGASTGSLDQDQEVPGTQLWAGVFPTVIVTQVFTADRTGVLNQVDVYLAPQGGGPFDATVTSVTDNGGYEIPAGPVLGSGEINLTSQTAGWYSIPLSSPAQITAGRDYALSFSVPTTAWAGYVMFDGLAGGSADPYPVAVRYATYWQPMNATLAFRTYVTSPQPIVTVPGAVTVPATSPAGATVNYTATAADAQGNPIGVTCTPASSTEFAIGKTSVTCTATDPTAGVTASKSFDVTVLDTDLSLSGVPSAITVGATSPTGAQVPFTPPTSVDEEAASVVCSQPPDSAFPVGTTTVTCTVNDPDDSPSSVSASFTVTVLGPAAQLTQLNQTVQGAGPGGSFTSTLQQVQADIAAGNTVGACTTLNAFENQVSAQTGKKLSDLQAQQLLASAQQIQLAAGC